MKGPRTEIHKFEVGEIEINFYDIEKPIKVEKCEKTCHKYGQIRIKSLMEDNKMSKAGNCKVKFSDRMISTVLILLPPDKVTNKIAVACKWNLRAEFYIIEHSLLPGATNSMIYVP